MKKIVYLCGMILPSANMMDLKHLQSTRATFMVHECPPANNVVHTEH